jgi:hypothetical protein
VESAGHTVTVAESEARVLSLIGRRLLEWEPLTAARIHVGERAMVLYSVLPMDVMCAFAVPAEVSAEAVDDDVTTSLASMLTGFQDALASGNPVRFDVATLPIVSAPVGQGLTLASLPPRDGWQMPIHGVSSDITPSIREAVEEFRERTAGMSERQATNVADEIWSRTAWAGLPMRVLHAARRLRLLTDEPLRVTAATCGPWKRLSTPRGQIFSYTAGIEARLGLRVVS